MSSGVLEVAVAETRHGQPPRGQDLPAKDRTAQGKFGLMFPHRAAFRPPDTLLVALARAMEQPTEGSAFENPSIPSGFTFLSQFVDHDLTFDLTPLNEQKEDPDATSSFRSPRFDLDSVYGEGPGGSPELYDGDKLRLTGLGTPDVPYDLRRQADGKAFIADPRNEENLIICQLQIACVRFHNALVDHVRAQGTPPGDVFEEARRLARWHYQWIVLHDFLHRFVGQDLIDSILTIPPSGPATVKLDFYKPNDPAKPMMPVEFSAAAYRFGHSMIRSVYHVNAHGDATLFRAEAEEHDLNGFRPIPKNLVVEWRHFFEIPGVAGQPVNRTRRIDTNLSLPLFDLPRSILPHGDTRASLAERNLIRGSRLGLPSGQDVADAMHIARLTNRQLGIGDDPGWEGGAPLWFYVLKEAELQPHRGARLGPVGARIVAEVVLGLLHFDERTYLNREPRFKPRPPIAPAEGQFRMGDLLRFAGAA